MGITVKKTVKIDNIKRLQDISKTLRSKKIRIGIFGSESSEILMIANVNEFGCDIKITPKMRVWLHANGLHVKKSTDEIHIPERSFVRKTVNERKEKIDIFVKGSLDLLFSFKIDADMFLNRVGEYLAGFTRETLTQVGDPPNHPFTTSRKKGKENTLINTGHLRMSITYKIE